MVELVLKLFFYLQFVFFFLGDEGYFVLVYIFKCVNFKGCDLFFDDIAILVYI